MGESSFPLSPLISVPPDPKPRSKSPSRSKTGPLDKSPAPRNSADSRRKVPRSNSKSPARSPSPTPRRPDRAQTEKAPKDGSKLRIKAANGDDKGKGSLVTFSEKGSGAFVKLLSPKLAEYDPAAKTGDGGVAMTGPLPSHPAGGVTFTFTVPSMSVDPAADPAAFCCGVSTTNPQTMKEPAAIAQNLPGSFLIGFDGATYSGESPTGQAWGASKFRTEKLKVGDVIVVIANRGNLAVLVNAKLRGDHALGIPDGVPLYGVLDLAGRVCQVMLGEAKPAAKAVAASPLYVRPLLSPS